MQFNNTSSTRLELQTVLWALETLHPTNETITIYTDSQNIVGLPARRQRLEEKNYYSRKNIPLKNEDIYRRFYQMEEKINFQLVKLEGHKAVGKREKLDHVFALVDQASRDVVRRGR